MSEPAKKLLNEIIAFFSTCQEGLGDGWAHDDEFTSYGLDYRHRNGTQWWLDLENDGIIRILWKPVGQDKPTTMYFSAAVETRNKT